MHIRRSVQLAIFASLLFLVGCVEICGQRITMRYDEKADTLYILLHYDGVHDSGTDRWGKGVDQLPKFVANGEVMLLGWPFHFPLAEIQQSASDVKLPAEQRALGQAIAEQVSVQTIGRYRDPLGRLGGAQLVTITKATALVRAINTAINAEIRRNELSGIFSPQTDMPGTRDRMLAAGEKDHQWLAIEGHALRISVPVHEQEWAAQKAKGLYEWLLETREEFSKNDAAEIAKQKASFLSISHSLANVPFAYGESDGIVMFRLGDPAHPATIRVQGPNEYGDNLESDLTQLVKQDVDSLLALRLTDDKAEPTNAGITALAEWGPPEERVRAAARAAKSDDVTMARRSYLWLRDFSADWNYRHNQPTMPAATEDQDHATFARACFDWCLQAHEFPNPRPAEDPNKTKPVEVLEWIIEGDG